jgi:hypothetical protein
VIQGPLGWKQKYLEVMLGIALEGPDENLPLIIKEAIPLWKNETKY